MRATYTSGIPEQVGESAPARAIFQRDLLGSLRPVGERVLGTARSLTRHPGVAAAYSVQEYAQGDTVGLAFDNPHPLFPILEGGSRPHVIVPRIARILRFEVGGQVVFARRVMHPGTRPQRMLASALQQHTSDMQMAVQAGLVAYFYDTLSAGGGR